MAEFTSRLCDVCDNALRLAFTSLVGRTPEISDDVPHHITKDSLVDSVLRQSCHLCRLLIYHLKVHYANDCSLGPEAEQPIPERLSEGDFVNSDFDYAAFPSDRVGLRSYMLGLPEEVNFKLQMEEFSDGADGVLGTMKMDCDAFSQGPVKQNVPRFWIFGSQAFDGSAATKRFNDNSATSSCQKMIGEWLETCGRDHDICKVQRDFLPTRLLDLEEVDTKQRLRLVDSSDCDPTARYVTLSHCWGLNVPVQLTSDTEKEMREGFDLGVMPPTFWDAIQVARWAKVRYLWIDSCCIIQGSKTDWENEAKRMEKVYKNTFFNISADHSESSQGGCFSDRLAYKTTPVPYAVEGMGKFFLLSRTTFMRSLTESPIASRAWVVQERFLSPRIIHFTADQIFWECATMCACETFPKGLTWVYDHTSSWQYRSSMAIAPPLHRARPDYYKIWGSICEDYSRTRLTYLSDKLIAFSGMARDFQARIPQDKYIAGMWRSTLEDSLLWSVMALDGRPMQPNGSRVQFADPYITASLTETYRAPSWSWLAKDCAIFWERMVLNPHPLIEILEADVDLVNGDEPAGDMQGGSLVVRGVLRAASWIRTGSFDSVVLDGKYGNKILQHSNSSQNPASEKVVLQRDTGDEFPTNDLFLLLVRQGISSQPATLKQGVIQGLVLGKTKKHGVYQRLGFFEAIGTGSFGALEYELLPPAREMQSPWETLGSSNSIARSVDGTTYVEAGSNFGEEDATIVGGEEEEDYDKTLVRKSPATKCVELFKKVEEMVVTII